MDGIQQVFSVVVQISIFTDCAIKILILSSSGNI